MKNSKFFYLVAILIILISCISSNKENDFFKYIKTENIKLNKNSLYLFLPNTACSFCVNTTLKYLSNSKSDKISLIFLDSDVLTMVDKDLIRKLHLKHVYYSTENYTKKYFDLKSNNHFLIFTIEFTNNALTIKTFKPEEQIKLIDLLKKYE